MMKPGMDLREVSELASRIANAFLKYRYSCVAHGLGQCDEWPRIANRQDRACRR